MFGVNASPFLLNVTLKYYINQYDADPGLVQNVLNSFYVDDLVTGERGVEESLSLYQKSKSPADGGIFFLTCKQNLS